MQRITVITLAAIALAGCATNFTSSGLVTPQAPLVRGAQVLIGTSANGEFGEIGYSGSGAQTSRAIFKAFKNYTGAAKMSRTCADAGCLDRYAKSPSTYLVVPEILRWEDRKTPWSGKPDQVEIKITVYEAKSLRTIASSTVYGVGPSQTLVNGRPEALVGEAVSRYISSLF